MYHLFVTLSDLNCYKIHKYLTGCYYYMRLSCSFLIILFLLSITAYSQDTDFSAADSHALNTDELYEQHVTTLSHQLTAPFNTEAEKARAIFRWITDRIEYDTGAFFSGSLSSGDPLVTLRRGSAVCSGYAALFKALAEQAGLEAEIITGHSKGYGFNPETDDFKTNHAWNAVRIDGEWKLVDPTWGAGYINRDTNTFQKHFEDFYFFTEPSSFIYNHFPDDERWQLLNTPVSKEEYKNMVRLQPDFFRHHLTLESHHKSIIEVTGTDEISLNVPENQIISARLLRNGVSQPANQVLITHEDDKARIKVMPPQRGTYELEIYARDINQSGEAFTQVLSYSVKNNRESADSGFPEAFGRYLYQRSSVDSPLSYVLRAGEEVLFSLRVPGAASVSVVNNSEWIDLDKDGDHFSGLITPREGVVQVAASFENDDQYSVLLEYQAR